MTTLSSAPIAPHLLATAPTKTPQSYLEYDFPLPTQRYVGLLACQRELVMSLRNSVVILILEIGGLGDPLLTSLVTEVVKCTKREPSAAPAAGKKKGKGSAAVTEEVKDEYEVELIDTGKHESAIGSLSHTSPSWTARL